MPTPQDVEHMVGIYEPSRGYGFQLQDRVDPATAAALRTLARQVLNAAD
ncbi:hypothetical protein [Rathayibacter sp. Leaf299]|nr:hypothetical protein [Rathayibacter sp. Leaf299]